MGDGNSVHGLGFNVSPSLRYVRDHLLNRVAGDGGSVIYSLDLDRDRMLDSSGPLCGKWLDRAVLQADALGLGPFGGELRRLRAAAEASRPFTWPGYFENGNDRVVPPDGMTAALLRDMIRHTFPDQRLENGFLLDMGVQAARTLDVCVVIDYASLPPMMVHEISGPGPEGMPAGAKAGEPAQRPRRVDPDRQMEIGDLLSCELSSAWREVMGTGDERLAAAFRRLARTVVSDAYLVPAEPSEQRTAKQDFGFDVRNAIGLAVQRGLGAGGMRETISRLKSSVGGYVDDPRMFSLLEDLGTALETHAVRRDTAARSAEALIAGEAAQAGARRPESAETAILGRVAVSGNAAAFGHAQAAFRAVERLDGVAARLPQGGADAIRTRVAEALRSAANPTVPRERIRRLALQIAAAAGPAVRGERWLSAVPQILAEAVCGFAAAASRGGIDLDLSRPPLRRCMRPSRHPRLPRRCWDG